MTAQDQSELMKMMVMTSKAKKGIEVGTFTGYSALCLAEGLPEDGKLICLDISEEYTTIAQKYWKEAGVDHKIDLRIAPGVETLDKLLEDESNHDSFDFAFVDAEKPGYDDYYEKLLKLLKQGGFIIFDNILFSGKVINPPEEQDENTKALRALAEKIQVDERVDICMLPLGDGISIVYKL
jgi:predicted O-methyltransferase YrrM